MQANYNHVNTTYTKLIELRKEIEDAVKRFRLLSRIAKTPKLIRFYTEKCKERQIFQTEIDNYLKANGIHLKSSGTVTGAFIRLQTNIKALLMSDPDDVSLTKAMYHEESLLRDYDFVLNKPDQLTREVIEILEQHVKQIKKDIEQVAYLSDLQE